MSGKLGLDAVAYYLGGTAARATWGTADANGIHGGAAPANLNEIPVIKDVNLNMSKGEADATTRGANGWKATLGGLKDGSVDTEMLWDPTDAAFAAFFNAWLNNETIACAFLDGDKATVGTQGLWADFSVTGFTKAEPLEGAQTVRVTLKVAPSSVAAEWVKVTA